MAGDTPHGSQDNSELDDNASASVDPGEGSTAPSGRRGKLREWFGHLPVVSIAMVFVLVLANSLIKLPYYVLSPGQATGLADLVTVDEQHKFPHDGDVLFTTVNLRQAHPFDALWAAALPQEELQKRETVSGDYTTQQYLDLNNAAMDNSKLTAVAVGLTRAGFTVSTTGDGALIQQISENSPVSGLLQAGEVITAMDDTEVRSNDQLIAALETHGPNEAVTLAITGVDKVKRTVTATLGTRPEQSDQAYLGVVVSTANVRLETPFPVTIDTTNVGGSSAGLAFTLAVLDELTPGSLTGNAEVAVTGTISGDGTVGPVGGVKQKAGAVNKTDAKLFLVPSEEYDDAVSAADDDVRVVKVDTLQQAIDALGANGGDISGVPAVTATNAT